MKEKKLIALDLDGTVLKDDKTISQKTHDAISSALKKGIEVVPVTGRPLTGLPWDLFKIKGINYLISSNGAVTTDFSGKKIIRATYINKTDAEWISRTAVESGAICDVFIDGIGYCLRDAYETLLSDFKGQPLEEYVIRTRKAVDDLYSILDKAGERAENIWIRCSDVNAKDDLQKKIEAHCKVRIVTTAPKEIEIGSINADKGLALSNLASKLGIKKDQIIAFGDNGNDIGMLNAAGTAVAMGNGTPQAKAAADIITDTNEQDGVAKIIESVVA